MKRGMMAIVVVLGMVWATQALAWDRQPAPMEPSFLSQVFGTYNLFAGKDDLGRPYRFVKKMERAVGERYPRSVWYRGIVVENGRMAGLRKCASRSRRSHHPARGRGRVR